MAASVLQTHVYSPSMTSMLKCELLGVKQAHAHMAVAGYSILALGSACPLSACEVQLQCPRPHQDCDCGEEEPPGSLAMLQVLSGGFKRICSLHLFYQS